MKNKVPQIHLVYDRRKTASPTKKSSVEIRITYDYKQKYISTGIMLYPNQWKDGIITNCADILHISQMLDKQLSDIKQVLLDMMNEGNVDIQKIPERLERKNQGQITFIEFCRQRTEIRKYGKKEDTKERYERFLTYFSKWGGIIMFEDINDANIIMFDKHLQEKKLKTNSKWHNYHRFLNSFIMDAINEGHITRNPYKWVNIKKGKDVDSINKHLEPEEFYKIKYANMPTESLERVRDVFIFQTYTCLSYSDLKRFTIKRVREIRGMNVYISHRQKTNQQFTIPLLKPACKVLSKYQEKLPIISNVKYNEYLKVVAQAAGVDKPISSHWARHTGATLLLNEGIDMRIVSKICGHSSMKITEQVYAKLLDDTIIDAMSNIDI